jgi:hypothetical protein
MTAHSRLGKLDLLRDLLRRSTACDVLDTHALGRRLRWQARQWQMETLTGSPSTSTVSCPHEQDARRVAMSGRYRAVERVPTPGRFVLRR